MAQLWSVHSTNTAPAVPTNTTVHYTTPHYAGPPMFPMFAMFPPLRAPVQDQALPSLAHSKSSHRHSTVWLGPKYSEQESCSDSSAPKYSVHQIAEFKHQRSTSFSVKRGSSKRFMLWCSSKQRQGWHLGTREG